MDIPSAIAAEAALTRQAVALEVIRKNAEAGQAIARILEQAADMVPAPVHRGGNVNFSA